MCVEELNLHALPFCRRFTELNWHELLQFCVNISFREFHGWVKHFQINCTQEFRGPQAVLAEDPDLKFSSVGLRHEDVECVKLPQFEEGKISVLTLVSDFVDGTRCSLMKITTNLMPCVKFCTIIETSKNYFCNDFLYITLLR